MGWIKKRNIFNKHWAQLPVVDVYPEYYKIYYSTRDHLNRSIPKWVKITKDTFQVIEYAEIGIINFGKPGSFDSYGIMPSCIITLSDGVKYMYYVGWSKRIDVPYWNSTGLAISMDGGETWKKYSHGPVFSSNNSEPDFIGTVEVIPPQPREKYEDIFTKPRWIMYYSSAHWEEIDNKQEPVYDIKEAISEDGINWKATGKIIAHLTGGEGGITAFRKIQNAFFYSIRQKSDYRTNPNNSYHIKSVDSNIEYEMLELAPEGGENMCAYPFIIEEKDKSIMFYNTDFGKGGISYAEFKK